MKSVVYYKTKSGLGSYITSESVEKDFLINPGSIYSEINKSPAALNTVEWNWALNEFNQDNHINLTLEESARLFAGEAGLTKARPDREVDMRRRFPGYLDTEDRLVVANATKARVDGDIFYKSASIFGRDYTTIAAKFAVATQILRDLTEQVEPADQERNGIRKDVLDRYLSAGVYDVHSIPEYDRNYLINLLHNRLRSTDYQSAGLRGGDFVPPTQFRIARLAAAYRDWRGYLSNPPCFADGKNRDAEGSGNACFVNMTDKALYAWYKTQYTAQMAPHRPTDSGSAWQKMAELLLPIAMIMDGLAAVEFLASLEAEELAVEEALTEEEVSASESRYFNQFCPV
jgi:hypothetical protein